MPIWLSHIIQTFLQITKKESTLQKIFGNTEEGKNKLGRSDHNDISVFNLTTFQDIAEVSCTKIDLN